MTTALALALFGSITLVDAQCGDISPVMDCGAYTGTKECIGKGAGCQGAGWFSKDNTSNPNQRINAYDICRKSGYAGVDKNFFGGNWGDQCRHPGASLNNANKAGGAMTAFGYTVTWKCAGEKKCLEPGTPTAPPTTCPEQPGEDEIPATGDCALLKTSDDCAAKKRNKKVCVWKKPKKKGKKGKVVPGKCLDHKKKGKTLKKYFGKYCKNYGKTMKVDDLSKDESKKCCDGTGFCEATLKKGEYSKCVVD